MEIALGCDTSHGYTDHYWWLFQSSYDRLAALGFQFDIKPGTTRLYNYEDEFDELKPGMHIQPDDAFDRDTEHDEYCRIDRGDVDYAADSSDDDEEDRERKALENWFAQFFRLRRLLMPPRKTRHQ